MKWMLRSTRVLVVLAFAASDCWSQQAFGTWKVNPTRSTFGTNPHDKEIILRIEQRAKGEVVTLDRILPNGVAATTSIVLFMDGQPRAFRGEQCSGTQSSNRLDDRTVEARFQCQNGRSVRMVRRTSPGTRDLVLEITEEITDPPARSRRVKSLLVFEKQQ